MSGFPPPRHCVDDNVSVAYSQPQNQYTHVPAQQPSGQWVTHAQNNTATEYRQQGGLTSRSSEHSGGKTAAMIVERGADVYAQRPQAMSSSALYHFRWFKVPHRVYRAGLVYDDTSAHWHRDSMTRESVSAKKDCYLSPNDGKLETLVVSSTYDVLERPGSGTWKRTKIRNVVPYLYQLALWPLNHTELEAKDWSSDEWLWVTLKWIPCCIALTIMVINVGDIEGEQRHGLNYEPFPYRYFGYPKSARNLLEHRPNSAAGASEKDIHESKAVLQDVNERVIGPTRLFILTNPQSPEMHGATLIEFAVKTQRMSYIFVAYTARQFQTTDWNALHAIGERAARDAKVDAFWIGSQCLDHNDPLEVYRISDIVRASSGLVVAVGPSQVDPHVVTADDMIREWGERVWTFPELLLSAPGLPVKIYMRGNELAPVTHSRLSFTAKVFNDSSKVRSLVDHYEGTAILSRLELTTLAYECIQSRGTETYLPGDHSYALMGLLNLRAVHPTDSAFQAFARLSLLNDSDRLLERLICMLPADGERSWSATTDQYRARLWDIEPSIQVSGLGEDDTVIIDGARASSVRWKGFKTVYNQRTESWTRMFCKLSVHSSGIFFYVGVALIGLPGLTGIGAFLLVYGLIVILLSPWLLRLIYGGKFWKTQAWMFAFEGYMPINDIEKRLFGARFGRLEWSPFSSPISRHEPNQHGECIGVDPTSDPAVKKLVDESRAVEYGQQRVFTLVDTATMTVTLFQAARPPIGFLLVGSEGGMQRAVGVSFDWESQALVKETVLRVPTTVIERMDRVPRVKLNLGRKVHPAHPREVSAVAVAH